MVLNRGELDEPVCLLWILPGVFQRDRALVQPAQEFLRANAVTVDGEECNFEEVPPARFAEFVANLLGQPQSIRLEHVVLADCLDDHGCTQDKESLAQL